jgi:hypothetical protein
MDRQGISGSADGSPERSYSLSCPDMEIPMFSGKQRNAGTALRLEPVDPPT